MFNIITNCLNPLYSYVKQEAAMQGYICIVQNYGVIISTRNSRYFNYVV